MGPRLVTVELPPLIADSWGDTVWGCRAHADDEPLNARDAVLSTEGRRGLGAFPPAGQPQPDRAGRG